MVEKKSLGALHSATRDLHHAVEQTAFGRSMAAGEVSEQAWTDWLSALHMMHKCVDPYAPESLRRAHQVDEDLKKMYRRGFLPNVLVAPRIFVELMQDETTALGAVYVLGGAHVMGGALISKRIGDRLPTKHMLYSDEERKQAIACVKDLRDRGELAQAARSCFATLLTTSLEIEQFEGGE